MSNLNNDNRIEFRPELEAVLPVKASPHILQNDNASPVQVAGDYCLNPGIRQCEGGWEAAWEQRQGQVDARLIDYLNELKEYGEDAVDRLSEYLSDWFDNEELSERAAAQWQRVRGRSSELRALIDQRARQLMREGRLGVERFRQRSPDD